MILHEYISQNKITQIYSKTNIVYFKDLNNYINLTKNTIFICENDFDVQLLNIHQGKKFVFILDIDNYLFVKNNINIYEMNELLCDSIEIYELTKNDNFECINIKSKISNYEQIIKVNTDKKILYLILASTRTDYIERYVKLQEYLKTFDIDYLILLGNHNCVEKKDHILYTNIKEYYENIPTKIITGLEWIYYNTLYSHIYKVDDDFFALNINNSEEIYNYDYYGNYIIKKLIRTYHFNKCNDKELNKSEYDGKFIYNYASGGYGYILSRKAIFILLQNKNYICKEMYEDKAIGDVLYTNNIIINSTNYYTLNYKIPNITKKSNIISDIKLNKKIAVILFHKNLTRLYKPEWINKCVTSITNQSFQNFDIFEMNYGNDSYSIFNNINITHTHYFFRKDYNTHIEAMLFLLNKCFSELNYDIVFNTNLDDYYTTDRFETQITCIDKGYLLCSSLMNYITEKFEGVDKIIKVWDIDTFSIKGEYGLYIDTNKIKEHLNKNHNIINHSCVCYTRKFWESYDKNNNLLRYRDDKPYEDLSLWQRAINNNIPITMINKHLIQYRIHENQIGEQQKIDYKNENIDGDFKSNLNIEKKRIGIFCIGTGNYINYLEQLIVSIEKYFLPHYRKIYFISTDQEEKAHNICKKLNITNYIKKINRKGFPLDTLYRYKYLLEFDIIVEMLCDTLYYIDIDMKINETIDTEILPTPTKVLIGVKHPGYAFGDNKKGDPETNPKSTAYIDPEKYLDCYIAGGFNGGITHYFLKMAKYIQHNIDIDKSNDIIAKWHDESYLNKYFNENSSKFMILSPDYCYPENYYQSIPAKPIIIALDKNHNQVRNTTSKNKLIVNIKGGIGNILFQLFTAYNIALRYNLEVITKYIDTNKLDTKRQSSYHYYLFDNILKIDIDTTDCYIVKEQSKSYENLLTNIPMNKNIFLTGYFQSTLYFKENFDRIKDKLDFKLLDIAIDIMNKINNFYNKKIVGVHVRGGDYLNLSHYYINLSVDYYQNIISKQHDEHIVILFTNDKVYSKNEFSSIYQINIEELIAKYLPIEYSYLLDSAELNMLILSLCDTIICSNSTYSLWASYFSKSKEIYIPKLWFGPEGPQDFNIEELILNDNYIIT